MKLLLSSCGFENPKVREEFLTLFDDDVSKKKVIFLHTSRGFRKEFITGMEKDWTSMGFELKNLNFVNMDESVSSLDFDVVCVCGGNTFYILDKMRKIGACDVIKEAVINGAVYVGISAGSIIAGPSIGIAGIGDGDVNDIELKDLTGLGLMEKIISPHYIEEEREEIKVYEEENDKKVIPLKDCEALLIDGEEEKLIK